MVVPYLDVGHAVIVQVGAGGKFLATDLAFVGFLTGMDTAMGVQRTGGAESLTAHRTDMGFLA